MHAVVGLVGGRLIWYQAKIGTRQQKEYSYQMMTMMAKEGDWGPRSSSPHTPFQI
jgi:hypothetical protein